MILGAGSCISRLSAAGGPYELTVSGSNQIVIHNVLVGDVWVASGQSNMEFKMRELDNPQAEIAAAKFPRIRIMRIKHAYSEYPLEDAIADQRWAEVSPESVPEFSAVAYYFAREIHQKEKVPDWHYRKPPGAELLPKPGRAWMRSLRMHR